MITNFLLDNSGLAPLALALFAVVCAGVGAWLVRVGRQQVLWVLAALSLVPVMALTFTPSGLKSGGGCTVQFALPTIGAVELLANVALFFPPVLFASLASRRPWLMLVAGMALSAATEAIQSQVLAIGRSCDTNDWAMNTAGTVLAVLAAAATLVLTKRKQGTETP
jgi:hypothetical protein